MQRQQTVKTYFLEVANSELYTFRKFIEILIVVSSVYYVKLTGSFNQDDQE